MPDRNLIDQVANLEPLIAEDWKRILSDIQAGGTGTRQIRDSVYQIRASVDLMNAIENLNQTSTTLSKRMIRLTWAILFLTAVMVAPLVVKLVK